MLPCARPADRGFYKGRGGGGRKKGVRGHTPPENLKFKTSAMARNG